MPSSPVGRETDRVDGRLKVTGAAEYSGDYRATDLAHAHLVTSTIARGTITRIETTAARAAPGVLRVYAAPESRLNLYPITGPLAGFVENYVPLKDTEVRFHGQAIAMVVAETPNRRVTPPHWSQWPTPHSHRAPLSRTNPTSPQAPPSAGRRAASRSWPLASNRSTPRSTPATSS